MNCVTWSRLWLLTPFLTDELWTKLGLEGSVHYADWPVYDPTLEQDEGVEMAVQVNGKLRGMIHMPTNAREPSVRAAAEALDSVNRHLEGKQVVKVILVPNRTINYVVKEVNGAPEMKEAVQQKPVGTASL